MWNSRNGTSPFDSASRMLGFAQGRLSTSAWDWPGQAHCVVGMTSLLVAMRS